MLHWYYQLLKSDFSTFIGKTLATTDPDVTLITDQNEKHKFMTTQRGFRIAASVGGSVTGEGGNFLIMDDPLSSSQAMSVCEREKANH
jgi:hypothetical protein